MGRRFCNDLKKGRISKGHFEEPGASDDVFVLFMVFLFVFIFVIRCFSGHRVRFRVSEISSGWCFFHDIWTEYGTPILIWNFPRVQHWYHPWAVEMDCFSSISRLQTLIAYILRR